MVIEAFMWNLCEWRENNYNFEHATSSLDLIVFDAAWHCRVAYEPIENQPCGVQI
jgi:hypothetical protein